MVLSGTRNRPSLHRHRHRAYFLHSVSHPLSSFSHLTPPFFFPTPSNQVTTGILWFGLRLENSRRARGESDETIMPPGTDAAEIESARAALREKDSASGGLRSRIRAVYRDLDMAPGGVYASVDEARMKKGDEWSGFRYGY